MTDLPSNEVQPAAGAVPPPEPAVSPDAASAFPASASAAPGMAPATPPRSRSRFAAAIFEWFWRSRAMREVLSRSVLVPPRARELERRARLANELARRALEPSGPLAHGTGDAVACELYREAVFWALSAVRAARGVLDAGRNPDLKSLASETDRELLLRAAGDADALTLVEGTLLNASFVDFSELAPGEQAALAASLRRFATSLLELMDAHQAELDRLRLQRVVRTGLLVLSLLLAVPVALLIREWSAERNDLARGRPWKASSASFLNCQSPAQRCAESPSHFFHTAEEDNPWLMIDLGSKQKFSRVTVENRTDCCPERAAPLVVEVSNDKKTWKEVASRKETFTEWEARFSPASARYVRFRVPRRTYLHLAQVRILR